jgi:hypothetical protein
LGAEAADPFGVDCDLDRSEFGQKFTVSYPIVPGTVDISAAKPQDGKEQDGASKLLGDTDITGIVKGALDALNGVVAKLPDPVKSLVQTLLSTVTTLLGTTLKSPLDAAKASTDDAKASADDAKSAESVKFCAIVGGECESDEECAESNEDHETWEDSCPRNTVPYASVACVEGYCRVAEVYKRGQTGCGCYVGCKQGLDCVGGVCKRGD